MVISYVPISSRLMKAVWVFFESGGDCHKVSHKNVVHLSEKVPYSVRRELRHPFVSKKALSIALLADAIEEAKGVVQLRILNVITPAAWGHLER